jgi:predicted DNA-binding transcriptional regulator AlpA
MVPPPQVDTDDLVDAQGAAELLGLSHPNSVITYLRRYEDFPRPVIDLGDRRVKLWSRKGIVAWRDSRADKP